MATETKQFPRAIFTLWKNKSKDGKTTFLSNKAYIGFYNTKKENPKEPDLIIYLKKDEKHDKEETALLWCNVSEKTGKKYLTGYLKSTKQKLIGFINKSDNEKAPYLNIYLSEELKSEPKGLTEEEIAADDDLPF